MRNQKELFYLDQKSKFIRKKFDEANVVAVCPSAIKVPLA
jgi:hypothetical protein